MRLVPRVTLLERWPLAAALLMSGLLAGPAAAEDFTGFYAGINAGWGRGSGPAPDERPAFGASAPQPPSALPPSAARAAGANPGMRTPRDRPAR